MAVHLLNFSLFLLWGQWVGGNGVVIALVNFLLLQSGKNKDLSFAVFLDVYQISLYISPPELILYTTVQKFGISKTFKMLQNVLF